MWVSEPNYTHLISVCDSGVDLDRVESLFLAQGTALGSGSALGLVEVCYSSRRSYAAIHRDPPRVYANSIGALFHELTHVRLYKETGDPDYNHADLPGPWTEQDDMEIEKVKLKYLELEEW